MELLITASLGLAKFEGNHYLTIITAENYEFYFAPITELQALLISNKENLEIEERDNLDGFVTVPDKPKTDKKYTLSIAFSTEAQSVAEMKGFPAVLKAKNLSAGLDYKVIEFDTEFERDAYILGANDGNGWHNEPYYINS